MEGVAMFFLVLSSFLVASASLSEDVRKQHAQPTSALPSIEEMQQRASPWSSHLSVEPAWLGETASFLLSGLVTQTELGALTEDALKGMQSHQEKRANAHATVSLDKVAELNVSVSKMLDKRLAALSGLPTNHVEEGYFSVYNAGYEMTHLHIDNHHVLFDPERVVSIVIYIVGEPPLTGGGTVFPLAQVKATAAVPAPPKLTPMPSDEKVRAWGDSLRDAATTFEMGHDPQWSRICPLHPDAEYGPAHEVCTAAISRANELCSAVATGSTAVPGVIRAKPGDAVITFHDPSDPRVIHGGCSVVEGNKVVLSKFVRAGPRPWGLDEKAFVEAREARQKKLEMKAQAAEFEEEDGDFDDGSDDEEESTEWTPLDVLSEEL